MDKKKSSDESKRLIAAFGHASDGLKAACRHPAFRIELLAACLLLPTALCLHKTSVEHALLIGSVMLVLITELLNTGIESAIDRISEEWHALSKQAKDMGSAAVLLSLLNAAAVWLIILAS